MENQDIRWKQRFANYQKALVQLGHAVLDYGINPADIIKEATVQRFEFTHELAWKLMKDFLNYEGITNIVGSRGATREAYSKGIIENGELWMQMIESRNATVHTYQESILEKEYNLTTYEHSCAQSIGEATTVDIRGRNRQKNIFRSGFRF